MRASCDGARTEEESTAGDTPVKGPPESNTKKTASWPGVLQGKIAFMVALATGAGMIIFLFPRIEEILWFPANRVQLTGCFSATAVIGLILALVSLIRLYRIPQHRSADSLAVWGLLGNGLALVLLYVHSQFPVVNQRFSCIGHIKDLGDACQWFAREDSNGLFPPLSHQAGKLMFENVLHPAYLNYIRRMLCPGNPHLWDLDLSDPEIVMDDHSYFYLGYLIQNDQQMRAFADAYKQRIHDRLPFDEDLSVPTGKGSFGGNKILRLRTEDKLPNPDANTLQPLSGPPLPGGRTQAKPIPPTHGEWRATIPILWDRCVLEPGKKPELIHQKGGLRGVNVAFLTGAGGFIPYGQWPLTEETLKILGELDQLGPNAHRQSLWEMLF